MKSFNKFRNRGLIAIMLAASVLTACSDDDDDDVTPSTPPAPPSENDQEVITYVKLIFTNDANPSDTVTAVARDDDGPGSDTLEVEGPINLDVSKTYTLTYEILNAVDPDDVEDIGEEIEEEDDEHQLFYAFTNNAFSDPIGNGNTDNRNDDINYEDEDSDSQDGTGNPVGLVTTWTTSSTTTTGGFFTTILKHQPGIKTDMSTVETGDSDFELTFVLNIQ